MKPIPNYEKLYSITRDGRIWSHKRNKFIKLVDHSRGYKAVRLHVGHKQKNFLAHRLVALTYLKHDPERLFVNHINGIKTDNRVENLEWCTFRENMAHACRTGLQNRKRKISIEQRAEIKDKYQAGDTIPKLAKEYNVSIALIHRFAH